MFCTQRSVERQNDRWKWTQMHPTWNYCWMNQKMLDEKFDQEQTSSNINQHDFFLLFYFYPNFESSQMHPTSKIFDVGWNVGCICTSLNEANVEFETQPVTVDPTISKWSIWFKYLHVFLYFSFIKSLSFISSKRWKD